MRRSFLCVLTLLLGCSAGMQADRGYTAEFGASSERHIAGTLPDILNRHAFRIHRTTTSSGMLTYETEWRQRDVLPGEAEAGVQSARTRLFITGDERAGVYQLRLRAENEVLNLGSSAWAPGEATPEFREWMRRLLTDLEAEYRSTGRR